MAMRASQSMTNPSAEWGARSALRILALVGVAFIVSCIGWALGGIATAMGLDLSMTSAQI